MSWDRLARIEQIERRLLRLSGQIPAFDVAGLWGAYREESVRRANPRGGAGPPGDWRVRFLAHDGETPLAGLLVAVYGAELSGGGGVNVGSLKGSGETDGDGYLGLSGSRPDGGDGIVVEVSDVRYRIDKSFFLENPPETSIYYPMWDTVAWKYGRSIAREPGFPYMACPGTTVYTSSGSLTLTQGDSTIMNIPDRAGAVTNPIWRGDSTYFRNGGKAQWYIYGSLQSPWTEPIRIYVHIIQPGVILQTYSPVAIDCDTGIATFEPLPSAHNQDGHPIDPTQPFAPGNITIAL